MLHPEFNLFCASLLFMFSIIQTLGYKSGGLFCVVPTSPDNQGSIVLLFICFFLNLVNSKSTPGSSVNYITVLWRLGIITSQVAHQSRAYPRF